MHQISLRLVVLVVLSSYGLTNAALGQTRAQSADPRRPPAKSVGIDRSPSLIETDAIRDALGTSAYDDEKPFLVGHADLNGDGFADLFVRSNNPVGACGTLGCPTYAVLATEGGSSAFPIELALSFGKVTVLPTKHGGMFDLRFDDSKVTFRWNGKRYQ